MYTHYKLIWISSIILHEKIIILSRTILIPLTHISSIAKVKYDNNINYKCEEERGGGGEEERGRSKRRGERRKEGGGGEIGDELFWYSLLI